MDKFLIDYITLEGGFETVSIEAYSEDQARKQLKDKYYDVLKILKIYNE